MKSLAKLTSKVDKEIQGNANIILDWRNGFYCGTDRLKSEIEQQLKLELKRLERQNDYHILYNIDKNNAQIEFINKLLGENK